jgi:hypothetical protein
VSEADDMLAELRGISVPPNMSNCRQFVDYLTRLASANLNLSSPDQLSQTIAHLSGALAEVINALGGIDEHLRKGSS